MRMKPYLLLGAAFLAAVWAQRRLDARTERARRKTPKAPKAPQAPPEPEDGYEAR